MKFNLKNHFKKLKPSPFKGKKENKVKVDSIKEKSISKKMILATTSILISLILILGITSYFITKTQLVKSTDELLFNKAKDSADLVDAQIKSYTLSIETLGNLDIISDPEIPMVDKFETLKQEKDRLKLSAIGLSDIQGNLLLDDGTVVDIYETEYFQKAIAGRPYFSEPIRNDKTGVVEIIIATVLKNKGAHVGVIVAHKAAEEFYEIANNIEIGETGYAFILNDGADVISHPTIISHGSNDGNDNTVNFSNFKDHVSDFANEMDVMGEKIKEGEPGIGRYMEDGKITHLGFAPIKSKGWTLIVSVNESEILAGLEGLKHSLIIMVIIAIIVGVIFSLLYSRSLTKPIAHVTDQAYMLSQLDLSQDIDKKLLLREDELGKMANSLQVVIENMRNLAKQTQESSHQVAASSEELAAISEESTAAATNIAETSNEIAKDSSTQLEEILSLASSIKEIQSQIQHVSIQTGNAKVLGENVFDKTELGKEKIEQVIVQMNNIENSNNSVKSSVNDIGTSSKEMNHMLEIIENVSEQTNLLALNAAIEAARAGEYGRGFAVVADEIRKLAEEAKKSTEEIHSLINKNNILIKDAGENMDFSSKEVELGITRVNEAKETFNEIAHLIEQITTAINEVATAAINVEDYVLSVVNYSSSIEDMSKEIAAQIQNSSASSQEQMASMEEITSSTETLARLAEELQLLIGNMKF